MADFSETLKKIVETPEQYQEVVKYGPASIHEFEDKEIFFVTFPKDMVDPSHLINQEVTLCRKNKTLKVDGMKYNLQTTFNCGWNSNTLFVGDPKGTQIVSVPKLPVGNIKILSNVSEKETMDFEHVKPTIHAPPLDLKERNFFKFPDDNLYDFKWKPSPVRVKKKKKKHFVEEKEITPAESNLPNGDSLSLDLCTSPSKKKKAEHDISNDNIKGSKKKKSKKRHEESDKEDSDTSIDTSIKEEDSSSEPDVRLRSKSKIKKAKKVKDEVLIPLDYFKIFKCFDSD